MLSPLLLLNFLPHCSKLNFLFPSSVPLPPTARKHSPTKPHFDASVLVTFTGARNAVKETYVVIQGHLPLVMMFDLDAASSAMLTAFASNAMISEQDLLMRCTHDLHAEISSRNRVDGISVAIRGIEAFASHLYLVRQSILKMLGLNDADSLSDPANPIFDAICDDPEFCPPLIAHNSQVVISYTQHLGNVTILIFSLQFLFGLINRRLMFSPCQLRDRRYYCSQPI